MAARRQYTLGRFRFDTRTGELWEHDVEVKLTPRAAAVLALLAERAQELITKQELFDHVWGGLAVTDDALTSCIQELRGALGDDARRPTYIETRHRRGYRLMVPVTEIARTTEPPPIRLPTDPAKLVGRAAETEELRQRFGRALSGQRQIVFVTGEPGIGKSALVGAFIESLDRKEARVARGQCLDHHGAGEPYMPLIEALTRLATSPDGATIKNVLATHAPSWLAQMPSLWTRSERAVLETRGRATHERMLRELTQAVEEIAAGVPLVLELEDMHWSDASTLDWVAHVARRPEPARLMVLATVRPADATAIAASLGNTIAELALHGQGHEIALRPLKLEAIETYLAARLRGQDCIAQPPEVARLLLERTGGNPLFVVSLVNQLVVQTGTAATPEAIMSVPDDVRRFIDRQIDALDAGDRELLTAASVVGRQFATAAVAAALEGDVASVEETCARLARQGVFIVKSVSGTWPDATPIERYAFRHDLHRELLYDRVPATRRALHHARVGRRLESAWAGRLDEIAAELAEHFDRGNQPARAIPHHQRAAAKALRRSANQEAIAHLQRALGALGSIADEAERTKVEVELRVTIGAAYMAMRGFGAPEVLDAYARAEALCEGLGERADLFPAIWGQWMFRTGRSEMDVSRRLGARLLALANKFDDAGLKIQAHHAMWATSFVCGELTAAQVHARSALALFDPKIHHAMASNYGNHDAACCARNFTAMALALVGDYEGSRATIEESVAVATKLNDPFSLALTLYFTSAAAQILGEVSLATANSKLSMQIATEHGLSQPKAWSMGVAGWCIAANGDVSGGLALGKQAITTMQAIQSRHFLAFLLGLLADSYVRAGHEVDAIKTVEDAIAVAEATGEHFYDAELYRLRGELLIRPSIGRECESEPSLRTAVTIAKKQGAKTLEHKATKSLRRYYG